MSQGRQPQILAEASGVYFSTCFSVTGKRSADPATSDRSSVHRANRPGSFHIHNPKNPVLAVGAGCRIPAVEQAGHIIKIKFRIDDGRGVCVSQHIFLKPQAFFQNVANNSGKESNVGFRTNVYMMITGCSLYACNEGLRGW